MMIIKMPQQMYIYVYTYIYCVYALYSILKYYSSKLNSQQV